MKDRICENTDVPRFILHLLSKAEYQSRSPFKSRKTVFASARLSLLDLPHFWKSRTGHYWVRPRNSPRIQTVNPLELLGETTTADGSTMKLARRGNEYIILANGKTLMS